MGLLIVAQTQTGIYSTTQQYANQTLTSAINFVNLVNESGYVVFYPNLTQAYSDLANAERLYNASPSSSVFYANKAVDEANTQYQIIGRYRETAVISMLALTLISGLALYRLSQPVAKETRKRRK